MFKKNILIIVLSGLFTFSGKCQDMNSYIQQGEFGLAVGGAHYFGDLNTRASLTKPKLSAGVFFRKQFSNYISAKIGANYARLGYSDAYADNEVQRRRNLSFNSDIWEITINGEFNFFKFYPGIEGYRFTPYVSLGIGFFSYDPYAYLNGEKYFLRALGTEGQGSANYPQRKQYSSIGSCYPISLGFKYNVTPGLNVFAEVGYRFTTIDYLDDVSSIYTPDAFTALPNGEPSPALLLSDRSYETGDLIGIKGRQRGNSQQNDSYIIGQVGVSFNMSSYKCPSF